MTDSKIIKPLTGIRCFLALLIVFSHLVAFFDPFIGNDFVTYLSRNSYSVIGFFVLSGFLTARKYGDSFTGETIHNSKDMILKSIAFSLNHVKKWYLIYLVTIIPYLIMLTAKRSLLLVCNLFLVQCLLPIPYSLTFNDVQWYLSCLMFLYLFSPVILMLNKKIEKNLPVNIVLLILVIFVGSFFPNSVTVFYTMPAFRIFHFGLGIILYNLCRMIKINFLPVICIFAIIVQLAGIIKIPGANINLVNLIVLSLFIIVFVNTDYESFLLTNKATMIVAESSLELYLIHKIFVLYLGEKLFLKFQNTELSFVLFFMILIFVISIATSIFYHNVLAKWSVYKKINKSIIEFFDKIIAKLESRCVQPQNS